MASTDNLTHTITVRDADLTFPRLTLQQINALCVRVTAQREAEVRALATELKLANYELFNAIFEVRARKVPAGELMNMCENPGIAFMVIEASLHSSGVKDNGEDKAASNIINSIPLTDAVGLAKDLVLDIPTEKPKKTTEEKKTEELASPLPATVGVSSEVLPVVAGEAVSTSKTEKVVTGKGLIDAPVGYGSLPVAV